MTRDELLALQRDRDAIDARLDLADEQLRAGRDAYALEHARYKEGDLVRYSTTLTGLNGEAIYRIVDVKALIRLDDQQTVTIRYEGIEQKLSGGDKHRAAFGHVRKVYRDLYEERIIGKVPQAEPVKGGT